MAKPIEESLAEYLLGLVKGPWTPGYQRECLAMWKVQHGERVASKVEAILLKEGKK